VIGDDVRGNVVISGASDIIVSYDRAFERVAGSTAFVTNQLELSYRQTREQSQVSPISLKWLSRDFDTGGEF
jgi:hypothetical protein